MARDSSVGIATRYGLGDPGIETRWGARFSAHVQTGPGAHQTSYTMGTGSFPGVKRPGRGVDHPPPSTAEVKEIVELYLYSPFWAFVACSRVNFTFTFTFTLECAVLSWALSPRHGLVIGLWVTQTDYRYRGEKTR